ncbi:NAD dependent epimerase/dehydratase [Plectosphaerella cucumerina]|uniref:NAD dependent epimerase/dehydratase n=1 Tax=Plectosphaerella cucumerina TaxID=40658 RepID=A0A8K0X5D0_9PEZI|nr:NAD dependent epimerase/dehydratase [Plectosphaerella cucumerina]
MSRHVLLLGGHGKIAQLLTPILLARSWTVTSVIRSQEQSSTIERLAIPGKGSLRVLVRSIEEVSSQDAAKSILDEVNPDAVVFAAGAGGKGDPSRTDAIDRDAASHFARAAAAQPSVSRFILISYIASRRERPSWWDPSAWADAEKVNQQLARYYKAKIVADEVLYEAGVAAGPGFAAVSLRPGTLTEEPAGKIELGRTKGSKGSSSRATVAEVLAELLEVQGLKTSWIDLLDGEEETKAAVERVVREGVDDAEGDPIYKKVRA